LAPNEDPHGAVAGAFIGNQSAQLQLVHVEHQQTADAAAGATRHHWECLLVHCRSTKSVQDRRHHSVVRHRAAGDGPQKVDIHQCAVEEERNCHGPTLTGFRRGLNPRRVATGHSVCSAAFLWTEWFGHLIMI
jgi:hypothetical protein